MECLVVIAHPLPESLTHALAARAIDALRSAGHSVRVLDLYRAGFDPSLTAKERASYYEPTFHTDAGADTLRALTAVEGLVLCFPTWWFGPPAMLKGWFDRVWAPGTAYDHAADLGAIRPRLKQLRHALAITTLGSPWWVDRLVMRQPVRRMLGIALLRTCAPTARFRMLSLYRSERVDTRALTRLRKRMALELQRWR